MKDQKELFQNACRKYELLIFMPDFSEAKGRDH